MIAGDAQVQTLSGASPRPSDVLRRFLAVAIPLLAIWIATAVVWYQYEVDKRKEVLVQTELERIDALAGRMAHEMDNMAFQLLQFSMHTELRQLLTDAAGVVSYPAFEQEFMDFMMLGGLLAQARVLDAHGMELLRINHAQRRPHLVPVQQLQPKGHRPYFRRAAALPVGRVDISPINQNVEQGKIEQPTRLMLRFSTPLKADDGSLLGVLVFNYQVKQLLDLMSKRDLLLGTGPFWLRAPRSAAASEVVAGAVRRTLSARLADAMDHLWQKQSGWLSVSDDDGLLVFTTLGKQTEVRYIQLSEAPAHADDWRSWRLLSLLPEDVQPGMAIVFVLPLLISFSLLLILASWLWARAGVQRELAIQQSDQLSFENRRLAQRLFVAQEEERRLLAQELHDEMGQSLTAVKTNAVLILRHCSKGEEMKVAEIAEEIQSISSHLFDVVRQRLRQLRPPLLDHAGLNICLKESVNSWKQRIGISCKLLVEGDIDDLSGETSISIYRIIQEALTNVSRHAQASSVCIRLHRHISAQPGEDEMIDLEIRDNGVGMHKNTVNIGLGLIGMRERAWALGGSFNISSSPGNGVAITVCIPLRIEQEKEIDL